MYLIIAGHERKLFLSQKGSLHDIQAIFAVAELHDRAVTISDCQVIVHLKSFQVLDKTALKVATTTCFHSRIHQALGSKYTFSFSSPIHLLFN